MAPPLTQWLVGASAAAFLVNQGMSMWKDHFRENPAPADTYATKDQLKEVHGRIKREREEINAALAKVEHGQIAAAQRLDAELSAIREQIVDNNAAGEARVEKLREKMDDQTNLIISVIRQGGAR